MDMSSENKAPSLLDLPPTVLLIDDEVELCASITKLLSSHGYKVIVEQDSSKIKALLKEKVVDVILLDIMLTNGQDGIAFCKSLRKFTSTPIIMLTAINDDVERVVSLEAGADNYITKPFSSRVLLAYIQASLRRGNKNQAQLVTADYEIYDFLGWKLNVTSRVLLSPYNSTVRLTAAEFILLRELLLRPQHVISRDQLMELIHRDSDAFDRSIDILISRLRSKIELNPRTPTIIITMRNAGYCLACPVSKKWMNSKDWQKLSVDKELTY
jgi:two-component system OmpR family response regulator